MKTISAKTAQAFAQKNVAKSKLFCGDGLFLYITEAELQSGKNWTLISGKYWALFDTLNLAT